MAGLLSVLLVILAALGAGGTEAAPAADEPAAAADVQTDPGSGWMDAAADEVLAGLAAARRAAGEIAYEYCDYEAFDAECRELVALAGRGLAQEAAAQYDRLYEAFLRIDTMTELAGIQHDRDLYDTYWSEEYFRMNGLWSDAWEALAAAGAAVMETGIARAFSDYVGPDMTALFLYYEPAAPGARELLDRKLELQDEYHALMDTAYTDITVEFRGDTWCLDDLYGSRGDRLAMWNYDAYIEVFDLLHRALGEQAAPLYAELIGLLRQEAADNGYDSYADYAYEWVYARDYTPADAQRFCDAVKPLAREYYRELYYDDISYDFDRAGPVMDAGELLGALAECAERLDPDLTAPMEELLGRDLYDIAPADAGRYWGAYTTALLWYDAPFLFMTLEGDCVDFITVSHEYGHFCDFWFNPQTNLLTQTDNLDLSEIHSNGLQALCTCFYDEVFTDHADVAVYACLEDVLLNIIEGCLYDEFQRRAMADGADLSAEGLNALYTSLCAEYGLEGEWTWDSTWAAVDHNFDRPLYYISYAASGVVAAQLRALGDEDLPAAAAAYRQILAAGSYDHPYTEVVTAAGLAPLTDPAAAAAACAPLLDRMTELARQYR